MAKDINFQFLTKTLSESKIPSVNKSFMLIVLLALVMIKFVKANIWFVKWEAFGFGTEFYDVAVLGRGGDQRELFLHRESVFSNLI